MSRVVIIGGGISGLSTAYRLQQLVPGAEITVLEERGRVGGNAWTERQDGFQVETGPNGFLDNKPATMQLCRDLDLFMVQSIVDFVDHVKEITDGHSE